MGTVFERELKSILGGGEKAIEKITKTCTKEEAEGYNEILNMPFMVIRAAGSNGIDLVACNEDFAFPIEVKSSVNGVLRFSKSEKLAEQAEQLKRECLKSRLLTLYAYRLKRKRGDPWRIFAIEKENRLGRRNELIYRKLPKIDHTSKGNLIMRWEDGMPLNKFIDYLMFLSNGSSKK